MRFRMLGDMPINNVMEAAEKQHEQRGWIVSARKASGLPYWILAWLWIALVAYGTLVPFQALEPARLGEGLHGLAWWWAWFSAPTWIAGPVDDWLTNVVLYVPVGMMLRLHLWQRDKKSALQFVVPIAVVVMMPWVLECVQSLMPYRVASLKDWLVNAGGGVAGVLVAVGLRSGLRHGLVHGWWGMVPTFEGMYWRLLKMRQGWVLRSVIVLLHVGLVMLWWQWSADRERATTINLMPFSHHFDLSYLQAAIIASQTLGFYLLVTVVLSLQYLALSRKHRLLGMLVWLVGLSVVREILMGARWSRFDVTEPILALVAGLLAFGVMIGAAQSVVRACRRRESEPVAVERRKARFAVQAD